MKETFRKLAHQTAELVGTPLAFGLAVLSILIWLLLGPTYHYSDTWQLVINTGTTVVTFLMVFLIQNSQNRDAKVFHIKLDELLRGVRGARTELVNLEELTDEEIELFHREFRLLHEQLVKKIIQNRKPSGR